MAQPLALAVVLAGRQGGAALVAAMTRRAAALRAWVGEPAG